MLNSKQRATLRKLANTADTIFQIGKGGINDTMFEEINNALEARELIKLRVLETAGITAKSAANEFAEKCGCDVVQVIGTKFVLYKPSTKNRQIEL